MSFIQTLKTKLGRDSLPAQKAYRLWAESYDRQPDNLMFELDRDAVSGLLENVDLQGKRVLDIGCGTGRIWPLLQERGAAGIVGCDASSEMLDRLLAKLPQAEVHRVLGPELPFLPNGCFDLAISTLTLAHLEEPVRHFREWSRILLPGGGLLITDLHPKGLVRGAQRSFTHGGKTLKIHNHVYPLEEIRNGLSDLGFREQAARETVIDDALKETYRRHGLLKVFEKFRGTPIHFAMLWLKSP